MALKRALLIGISEYKDYKLSKLSSPLADTQDLAELLKRDDVGAFDEVELLLNSTLAHAKRRIANLCDGRSKDDFILFYFSGHGILDFSGDLFFVLADTIVDELYATALHSFFVRDVLNKSRSRRQLIILDCCHSGAFASGVKGHAVGATAISRDTFEVDGYGREVLASNAATQFAWEGQNILGNTDRSLFTHFLVEGLQTGRAGAADSDVITAEQVYRYAHDNVVRQQPFMRPQRWSDRQEGALVIAKRRISESLKGVDDKPESQPRNTVSNNEVSNEQNSFTEKPSDLGQHHYRVYKIIRTLIIAGGVTGLVLYGCNYFWGSKQDDKDLIKSQFMKYVLIEYCDFVRNQTGSRTDVSLQLTVFNGSGFDCLPSDRRILCGGSVGRSFKLPNIRAEFDRSGRVLNSYRLEFKDKGLLSVNPPRNHWTWTINDVDKAFTAIKVGFRDQGDDKLVLCEERAKLDRWSW